jgi:hypothetical protein
VELRFDEVVSEGGSPNFGLGTGDLEKLVLFSPTRSVPVVRWHRSRITVRPREGWRPNTVYRVQLLPGVTDIRNNKGVKGGLVTFTTGAPVPDYTLSGMAYDWTANQPMRGGLIEAVLEPDSLVYKGSRIPRAPMPSDRAQAPTSSTWVSTRTGTARSTHGGIRQRARGARLREGAGDFFHPRHHATASPPPSVIRSPSTSLSPRSSTRTGRTTDCGRSLLPD